MSTLKYEQLVEEDLNVGTQKVWIHAPGGGELCSTQVGIHSVARGQKAYEFAWTPGAIAAGGYTSISVEVPTSLVGDFVMATHDKLLTNDLRILGRVSEADWPMVVIHNPTAAAITVPAGTLRVLVFPSIETAVPEPGPTAEFTYAAAEGGVIGEAYIQFTDASSGSNISAWSWDTGDSQTETTQNPLHLYEQGGGGNPQTFTVVLTVTDDNGTDDVSHDVEVTFNS